MDLDDLIVINNRPSANWKQDIIDVDEELSSLFQPTRISRNGNGPNMEQINSTSSNISYVGASSSSYNRNKAQNRRHQKHRNHGPKIWHSNSDEAAINDYIQNLSLSETAPEVYLSIANGDSVSQSTAPPFQVDSNYREEDKDDLEILYVKPGQQQTAVSEAPESPVPSSPKHEDVIVISDDEGEQITRCSSVQVSGIVSHNRKTNEYVEGCGTKGKEKALVLEMSPSKPVEIIPVIGEKYGLDVTVTSAATATANTKIPNDWQDIPMSYVDTSGMKMSSRSRKHIQREQKDFANKPNKDFALPSDSETYIHSSGKMKSFKLPAKKMQNSNNKGTPITVGPELDDMFGADSIYLPTAEKMRQPITPSTAQNSIMDEPVIAADQGDWKTYVHPGMFAIIRAGNRKFKEFAEKAEAGQIMQDTWSGGPYKVKKHLIDVAKEYGIHCIITQNDAGSSVLKMIATPKTQVPVTWQNIPSSKFADTPIQRHPSNRRHDNSHNSKDMHDTHRNRDTNKRKPPPANLRPKNNTVVFNQAPALDQSNTGFKLLQSMGWKEGDSIGRTSNNPDSGLDGANGGKRLHLNQAGLIDVVYKSNRAGLGN